MKISGMIKNLQELMEKHGDLDCWYAVDDEGNGYQKIHYEPVLYYVPKCDSVYADYAYISIKDVEDNDLTIEDVTPICIVN